MLPVVVVLAAAVLLRHHLRRVGVDRLVPRSIGGHEELLGMGHEDAL